MTDHGPGTSPVRPPGAPLWDETDVGPPSSPAPSSRAWTSGRRRHRVGLGLRRQGRGHARGRRHGRGGGRRAFRRFVRLGPRRRLGGLAGGHRPRRPARGTELPGTSGPAWRPGHLPGRSPRPCPPRPGTNASWPTCSASCPAGHHRVDPLVLPRDEHTPPPRPGSAGPPAEIVPDESAWPAHVTGEGIFTLPTAPSAPACSSRSST